MGIGSMINKLLKKDGSKEGSKAESQYQKALTDTPETEDMYITENLDTTESKPADSGGTGSESPEEEPPSGSNTEGTDNGSGDLQASAPLTEEKVREALSEVYDPEIPIDIVNLGLIYGVEIEGTNVLVRMTMTAPGCPASTQIAGESKLVVQELDGVERVDIDIVWDPPWDPSKMSEEAQQSMGML